MGAKFSRKKSEAGLGAETTVAAGEPGASPEAEQAATAEALPKSESAEQKPSEVPDPGAAPEESKPIDAPASSTSVLNTITQAVEETVNAVTEQIAAPVEDVVNKGIEAVESAMAAFNLKEKEPAEHLQDPAPLLSEPTLLDDLLKSQPMSEALVPELDSGIRVESEGITNQMVEDKVSNPATENKDLLECLDRVVAPSIDLLDCTLTHESTIPNSDPSSTLGEMGQEPCTAVDNLI